MGLAWQGFCSPGQGGSSFAADGGAHLCTVTTPRWSSKVSETLRIDFEFVIILHCLDFISDRGGIAQSLPHLARMPIQTFEQLLVRTAEDDRQKDSKPRECTCRRVGTLKHFGRTGRGSLAWIYLLVLEFFSGRSPDEKSTLYRQLIIVFSAMYCLSCLPLC